MAPYPTAIKQTTLQPNQFYSDLDDSFGEHPITGDLLMVTGDMDVVQSIRNLVQLNYFDVPFHPEIGGNVEKLLFDINDDVSAQMISSEITNVIKNFEPRAQVISCVSNFDNINQGVNVTLTFYVLSNPNPLTINMFLERLK